MQLTGTVPVHSGLKTCQVSLKNWHKHNNNGFNIKWNRNQTYSGVYTGGGGAAVDVVAADEVADPVTG